MNFITLGNILRLFALLVAIALWMTFFTDREPMPAFEQTWFNGDVRMTVPEDFEPAEDKTILQEGVLESHTFHSKRNREMLIALIIPHPGEAQFEELQKQIADYIFKSAGIDNIKTLSKTLNHKIGKLNCNYEEYYFESTENYFTIAICPVGKYMLVASSKRKNKAEFSLTRLVSSAK